LIKPNPVYCALDVKTIEEACEIGTAIAPYVGGLKIGMEFFYSQGIKGYERIAEIGLPIFLDLKLHDIANTVAEGLRALAPLQPSIINVHTHGGFKMMQAAASAYDALPHKPTIIGVTVLTSLDDEDLAQMGFTESASQQALAMAQLAHKAGLSGVVCSSHEIEIIRAACGPDFKLIVPGIRPATADHDEQKRIMTPRQAYHLGADILVIGRPITQSKDPRASARDIALDLEG